MSKYKIIHIVNGYWIKPAKSETDIENMLKNDDT